MNKVNVIEYGVSSSLEERLGGNEAKDVSSTQFRTK